MPKILARPREFIADAAMFMGHFTLEDAVRRITSLPADAWGFTDRGRIAEGMAADLNVFENVCRCSAVPSISNRCSCSSFRSGPGFAIVVS